MSLIFNRVAVWIKFLLAPIAIVAQGIPVGTTPPPVRVPIEVADRLVYVSGQVNGSAKVSAVLDTGSSLTVVTPEVARELNLKASGSTEAAGLGHGSSESMQLVPDVRLQAGDRSQRVVLAGQNIAILPIDYIARQTGHATDAIFGSNFFVTQCVEVDYADGWVEFRAPGCSKAAAGNPVPIDVNSGVPFVTATLIGADGTRVSGLFMVDSGTTGALILNKQFLAAHPSLMKGTQTLELPPITAVGGSIPLQVARMHELELGPFRLKEPTAAIPQSSVGAFANPSLAGFIGAEILRRFEVTWDYALKTVVLKPNDGFHDAFEADASGLRLTAGSGE